MKRIFRIFLVLCSAVLLNCNVQANCIPLGGQLTLTRQSEVDSFSINYPGCTVFEGNLTISGSNIVNLNGLNLLDTVRWGFIIDNTNIINLNGINNLRYCQYLGIYNNFLLPNIDGLNVILKVNELNVSYNRLLTNLNGLKHMKTITTININDNQSLINLHGLDSLTYANDFTISGNPLLTNFNGLGLLQRVISFNIRNNRSLINFTGLTSITEIDAMDVFSNASLINFDGLQHLSKLDYFIISDNASLINLIGFNTITAAGQHLIISHNPSLVSFDGLNNLKKINSGLLVITYNASLVNLEGLNNLESSGGFEIRSNDKLKNLKGLGKFNSNSTAVSGTSLLILDNPSLCTINDLNHNMRLQNTLISIVRNPNLNCCKIMDTIFRNNRSNINSIYVEDNATGCNDTIEIRTITVENCCTTKYTFLKDTLCLGDSILFDNHTLTTTGTYYDTITSHGIDSIIILELMVYNKSYQIINKNFCIGQQLILSNGRIITTNGIYKDTIPSFCDSIIEYHVNFVNNITVNQSTTICQGKNYTLPKGIIVNTTGTYKDTLRSSFGCDSIVITNLIVTNPIAFAKTDSICDGQTYTLSTGKTVTTSGIYNDTIRNINTCDSVVVTTLSVFPNTFSIQLNAIDSIDAGNTIELKPNYTNDSVSIWNWSPATSLSCTSCENPIANPTQNSTYIVKAKTQKGCEDTAQTTIIVKQVDVYIPAAFSPNQDGINDEFTVFVNNPLSFHLSIFNRWNQLVFESYNVNNKWNGLYKNEEQSVDEYFYVLDVTTPNGKVHHKQGTITLLR